MLQKDRAASGCNRQASCLHVWLQLSWLTQPCVWLILFVLPVAYLLLFQFKLNWCPAYRPTIMASKRIPADIHPITPCKKRCTYIAADTVYDLSPSSPFAFDHARMMPDPQPSAATASPSALASGNARVWKMHLKAKSRLGGQR